MGEFYVLYGFICRAHMALEKRISEDKIEFIGAARSLQIRELTEVLDDGVVISHSFHRRVLSPC